MLNITTFILTVSNILCNVSGMLHYFIARGLFRKLELKVDLSSAAVTVEETAKEDETDNESSSAAGQHNLDVNLKDELDKLEDVQKQALRFWLENPRGYIFSKEDMAKVDKLQREVGIIKAFRMLHE